MLYEFWLSRKQEDGVERSKILSSIYETAARTFKIKLAEASFRNSSSFRYETISPYVVYSVFQSAIIQYRLWRASQDAGYKHSFDQLRTILNDFKQRWLVAGE